MSLFFYFYFFVINFVFFLNQTFVNICSCQYSAKYQITTAVMSEYRQRLPELKFVYSTPDYILLARSKCC